MNGKIKPGLAAFFQNEVLTKLDLEFDKICDEMQEILKGDTIDLEGGP